MKEWNFKKIAGHLGFWTLYVAIEFFANIFHYQSGRLEYLWADIFLYLPAIVIATYVVSFWLVPKLLQQRKYVAFGLGIGVVLLFVYFMRQQITSLYIYFREDSYFEIPFSKIVKNVIRDYSVIALAVCIQIIADWQENLVKIKELTRSKSEAELNFLKSQLNPHFLFNTLNNIYSLARKKSDSAPESILMLSQILDYLIYECRQDMIPLKKELAIIRDYIELERLRYGSRLLVRWEEYIQSGNFPIPPLLLLTLVENAFKHGGIQQQHFELAIRVEQENGMLEFEIQNTVKSEQRSLVVNGSHRGVGLTNLQERLRLQFPRQHTFSTTKQGTFFTAKLTLEA